MNGISKRPANNASQVEPTGRPKNVSDRRLLTPMGTPQRFADMQQVTLVTEASTSENAAVVWSQLLTRPRGGSRRYAHPNLIGALLKGFVEYYPGPGR